MQCVAYPLSWTTSPLCPLASRVVARGNKPADIVISPRSSDAGASLNQSGPGTCRRHRRLVATSLCSPRLRVYWSRVRAVHNGLPIHFSSCLFSIHFFNPCLFSITSFLILPCLFSIISCLISILCYLFPLHSYQEYMFNLNNSCLFSILTYV